MGIKVGSNFDLEAAEFLDSRNSTNTISSLTSDFTTSNTPEGFEVFVKEKGKWYQATKNTNKIVWNERPSGYVDLKGYATESWVNNKNYITSTSLNGYATELWVTGKNYINASALNGYATQSWVNEQAFLKANALSTYSKIIDADLKYFNKKDNVEQSVKGITKFENTLKATKVTTINTGTQNVLVLDGEEIKQKSVASFNADAVSKSSATPQAIASDLTLKGKVKVEKLPTSITPLLAVLANAAGEFESLPTSDLVKRYSLPAELTQAYINANFLNAQFITGSNRMIGGVVKPALYVNMGTYYFDIVEKIIIT